MVQVDPPVAHCMIVTRRAGRRINDGPGASHTLCGAARTDRDLSYSDAWVDVHSPTARRWLTCPKCRAIIEARK